MANIALETGCFQSECGLSGSGALFILEKTTRKRGKLPIVFSCVLQNAPPFARDSWQDWFRERALALCGRGSAEKCVDWVQMDFEGYFAEYFTEYSEISLAALFVMGEECFYAWRGEADIRLLNDCFGRLHMKRLAPKAEELCCRRAGLEPGVGIILGSAAFFDCLPEPVLMECLAMGEIRGKNRVQRRLAEAAQEAERRGADDFAAAMIVTGEEQHEEFWELLECEGCGDAELVGSGAFGRVYRVRKKRGGKHFACKLAEDPQARALLRREAKLQSSLEHPLFARYVRLVEGEYTTALFMEYVRGRDLDELLRRGPLSRERAVDLARQLAEGLLYLHEREEPVIYRDLKPGNIRVRLNGSVKLLDLGCACSLAEACETKAGSRGYAAPEQLGTKTEAAGRAGCGIYSDVYAWGRVFAAMLGGICAAPALLSLIEECTREKPSQRPQSMRDVLRELDDFRLM